VKSIKQLVKTKRFKNSLICLLVLVCTGCFRFHHVASPKLVALTFDDGPYGEATNQILDILKKERVFATFFLLGINVEKYPAITKRIVNEGHVIGNHSYSHSNLLSKMPTADFQADVRHAENLIVSATGLRPRYYRPPYNNHTPSIDQQLKDMGYFVVLWDVGTTDYDQGTSSETIVEEIVRKTLKGKKHQHIILLHDGRDVQIGYPRQNVTQALPQIIGQLKERGYRFVTVEQIIHQSPYILGHNPEYGGPNRDGESEVEKSPDETNSMAKPFLRNRWNP
jgi:peptidoglycan/xylan/chitin deacetylase (PgdA/CDA1 family)